MMTGLDDDVLANVIRYADARLGGRFRLDGSKPIEKGLDGYQVYVHDRRLGATSVITDTSGRPVRIKPL